MFFRMNVRRQAPVIMPNVVKQEQLKPHQQLQRKVEEIIHFLLPFCTFSVGEMWLTDQSCGQ